MTPFELELDRVHSIVIATVHEDGSLAAANTGFLRLVDTKGSPAIGMPVGHLFIQPDFRSLLRATPGADGLVYGGLLTFGDDRKTWTLEARIWREGSQLSLLAEFDIGGMEELNERILDLNNYYATAQFELAQANLNLRQAATVFLHSHNGIIVTDANGIIADVNPAFTRITGFTREEVIGQSAELLASSRHTAQFDAEVAASLLRHGFWQGEVWRRRKNGEEFAEGLTISAVRGANGELLQHIRIFSDITGEKQAAEQIHRLAFFDQLTGLPNRGLLIDRLKQAMGITARSGAYGSLLFLDLDDFKRINDTLGHYMGDVLLTEVAQRLLANVRAGDTVARFGGDEFLIMLPNLSTDRAEAALQTEIVGEKLRTALAAPFLLGGTNYNITPSIGVTLFQSDLAGIDDVLKQADLAMYKAKSAGRNALCFFDPGLESAARARTTLDADLRTALAGDEMTLDFQPQVDGLNCITGAVALLRWRHPRLGLLMPADFIPLAEETGLIVPLGDWALQTVCTRLARWADNPRLAGLTIAVNVSSRQFREPGFVDRILAMIAGANADPGRLVLELTEGTMARNLADVVEKMRALRAAGVSFSLDRFGTGYSSFSHLKRLPLRELKIDRSFVRDILTDPNDATFARTIVHLAASLGLGVVAEGVETAEQREFLIQCGCRAFEGSLYSPPLRVEDFEELACRQGGIRPIDPPPESPC